MKDPFTLVRKGQYKQLGDDYAVVKISKTTYSQLCVAAAESRRSLKYVADNAIAYALNRVEFVDECGE